MLQDIREKSQGWIAWTIVSAICITFALWGIHSYLYSNASTSVVAKVNGVKITQQALSSAFNQLRRQQAMQLGPNYSYSQKQSNQLKKMALQSLVSNVVMNQAATKNGFRVGSDLVETAIAKMPIFQVKGVFSSARFQQVLSGMLFSEEEFFEQLQQTLIMNQLRTGIITSAFALPFEVNHIMELIGQKRDFGYTLIPAKSFLSDENITTKIAQNYYKQHMDAFKTNEEVSIEYIQLSVAALMQRIHPTNEQLHQFYQDNIASYTIPKQWQLARIVISVPFKATQKQKDAAQIKVKRIAREIQSGQKFEQLAKQYSMDEATADQGGKMPWMSAAQMDEAVRAVLSQLKKTGDISNPVRTKQGFEIVKLLNTKAKKVFKFDQVSHKALDAYRQQKAEQQFSNLSDELANLTYENPNSLDDAAKKLKLSIHTTPLFTHDGLKTGIAANPKVIRATFSDEVLAQGNNSDPVNLNDSRVIVLRVKQHIPSKTKPFQKVQTTIVTQLKNEAAAKEAKKIGKKLLASLKKGLRPTKILAPYHLNWIEKQSVSRNDKAINPSVLNLAFSIAPSIQKTVPAIQGESLDNGDFVIVALRRVKNGDGKHVSVSKRSLFAKGQENSVGTLEYQLYTNQLLQDAKVKYYNADSNQ